MGTVHTWFMPFRVLIFGSHSFRDYAKLRSVLDIALSKRLPDLVLVTTGGSGLPALVASYGRSRNLPVEVTPITRYPLDVRESPLVALRRVASKRKRMCAKPNGTRSG